MKNYSLLKEHRLLCLAGGPELDLPSSAMKKKDHFHGASKENTARSENSESYLAKSKCRDLKKRLHAAEAYCLLVIPRCLCLLSQGVQSMF